ncbi:MAG: hypothetical protein HYX53_15440 [Chloroflexi bacterium]|nr:hypothetical protein [Chloroflexota bacterium]
MTRPKPARKPVSKERKARVQAFIWWHSWYWLAGAVVLLLLAMLLKSL